MIGVLMPVEWRFTIDGKVPIRWAGWVDFGLTGVQWIEVGSFSV